MRSYHVASIALAVDRPVKWVDNLLSHHAINGVVAGGRGVTRRVSLDGVVQIAAVAALSAELDVSVDRAVALAARLVADQGETAAGRDVTVRLNVEALHARVEAALADVSEHSVPATRGRPPRKRSGALE